MSSNNNITIIGIFIIIIYSVKSIAEFYGFNISTYGSYIIFYIFLLVSYLILPHNYDNNI